MDTEEFIRKYTGEGRDFTGRRFGGERYEEIFRGIYREADFDNTSFDGCSFEESDLSFAKFQGVRLYETMFKNCLMEGADFSYAYFGQAGFYSVDLRGAIFRNANFIEGDFDDTVLSYADLTGAKNLIDASYKNVIFYETIMPNGQIYTGRT
ncbi:pentapeptide repeat-containing protein [Chamaesiphon sp. VAR_48_metabat_403]|uniref:pentapeptide repeat-containing protein n=1 Tax=Chamaesiphon sp. VAR_48_metabat_403 TaxID=2964700 RepID=UPI00286D6C3C|nr:pentapeptide repeat-containing protein [Chamaesiphon sp. VAR_48_metabat_403]